MKSRLVLDDLPWDDSEKSDIEIEEALEQLCDLLRQANDRDEAVAAHNSLHEISRIGNETLEDLIARLGSRDLRVELRRYLSRIRTVGDDDLRCFEVEVVAYGNTAFLAPSVVLACQQVAAGYLTGCVTPACARRRGFVSIILHSNPLHAPLEVFFVSDSNSHVGLFRQAIVQEHVNITGFAALASFAFPDLVFVDGAIDGCRDLSRPFINRIHELVKHLSILNDFGADIFSLKRAYEIERGFAAHGVIISRETTETIADGHCRRARERIYQGKTLLFEWHTKIEPHIDRIHVHPPTEVSLGKVIVGIVSEHLPLPGG